MPTGLGGKPAQTPESFWARVDIRGDDECWEWQGWVREDGYGNIKWHGKTYLVHRIAAWLGGLLESPAAPKSKADPTHVLHTCDNRKCCNYKKHFFLGTQVENMKDASKKGRIPKGENSVNAKVTREQALDIRMRRAKGVPQKVLCKEYGLSKTAVSYIANGRRHK